MKTSLFLPASALLFGSLLYGCMHHSSGSPAVSAASPKKGITDLIAGTRAWHGTHLFDGITESIGYTATLTKINDSEVEFSVPGMALTYLRTDSMAGTAIFQFKWGPPTLYYYYNGDSMHYVCDNGGIHNEQYDLHTP
jgi:hypothetical protein